MATSGKIAAAVLILWRLPAAELWRPSTWWRPRVLAQTSQCHNMTLMLYHCKAEHSCPMDVWHLEFTANDNLTCNNLENHILSHLWCSQLFGLEQKAIVCEDPLQALCERWCKHLQARSFNPCHKGMLIERPWLPLILLQSLFWIHIQSSQAETRTFGSSMQNAYCKLIPCSNQSPPSSLAIFEAMLPCSQLHPIPSGSQDADSGKRKEGTLFYMFLTIQSGMTLILWVMYLAKQHVHCLLPSLWFLPHKPWIF